MVQLAARPAARPAARSAARSAAKSAAKSATNRSAAAPAPGWAGKPPREAGKREAKKHEILLAASVVFRRLGLHRTGMRDIADELGMHGGILYFYFDNKLDLVAFCQEHTLELLLARARRSQRAPGRADQRLWLLLRDHVVTLNEEVPASLAHFEVEGLEPRRRRTIVRQRDAYERILRALIVGGRRAGVFRAVDAKVAGLAILGALNWTVKWYRDNGGAPARSIGDQFARLMVGGLMAEGMEPRAPAADEV